MIDGYEKHTCTECETMFTSNEELQQHHTIDHGLIIENSIEWTDVQPEDKVEETDNGFISNGKKITFSDEDKSIAESYLTETAKLQRVMVASEQRLKLARDEIKASEAETNAFYEQFLGESNGQDFSSGAGTIKPLDTPKFKYSKNKKLADTINTKGYNPNPNAGLYDNKQFKEGGDHLEDPLAKEDFEVSFYSGESRASELGIGSTFNMSGSASDVGEQEFWCRHIGTGGIKCGEPFPEHFNGNIEDHDFYPIAQSTQDQMDGKLNESKASEGLKEDILDELRAIKEKGMFGGDLDFYQLLERGNGLSSIDKAVSELYEEGKITGYDKENPTSSVLQINEAKSSEVQDVYGKATYLAETKIEEFGEGIIPSLRNIILQHMWLNPLDASVSDEADVDSAIDDVVSEYKMDKLDDGEAMASEDQHTDAWDEKYGQDLCPICKDSGNCNSMVFHAKLWNDVKEKPANEFKFGEYEVKCDCDKDPDCKTCGGKGTNTWTSTVGKSSTDESLKADWDDSDYEEKYSWLKDLGVEDAFKYANMTLYELPEPVWKIVNEDYVKGFKQMTNESYQPDQKDVVETSEEKIISRKLGNVPVGQIARELVLWDNMSAEEAEKMVSETEPNDNDITAQSLFNKKYSELNENELAEMELYDV